MIKAYAAFEPGGALSTVFGGGGYCISKQSKAPDKVFELLEYGLLSREGQLSKYERAQFFPTRLDVMDDPRIVDVGDPYYYDNQKVGAVLAAVAPSAQVPASHPFLAEAMDALMKAVPVVAAGEKSPGVALQDAAQAVRDLIAQG